MALESGHSTSIPSYVKRKNIPEESAGSTEAVNAMHFNMSDYTIYMICGDGYYAISAADVDGDSVDVVTSYK